MQSFNARTNLIRRLLIGRNSDASLSAMALDREFLYERGCGWNADFVRQLEEWIDLRDVDFTSLEAVAQARVRLTRVLTRRRQNRIAESGSSFIAEIFPSLMLPSEFLSHLSDLPHESVRIILIFFGNLMQWTYFRASSISCPFCRIDLDSRHFFDCTRLSPNQITCWQSLVSEFQQEQFQMALDRLFLTIQRWTIITNRFQSTLTSHLDEYFECTDYQNRGPFTSRAQQSSL
jgi:hypothetical protein